MCWVLTVGSIGRDDVSDESSFLEDASGRPDVRLSITERKRNTHTDDDVMPARCDVIIAAAAGRMFVSVETRLEMLSAVLGDATRL